MNFFRFINRKQCRHRFTLSNHLKIVVSEEQCVLEAEHKGPHIDRKGQQWVTRMDKQRILEDRGQ